MFWYKSPPSCDLFRIYRLCFPLLSLGLSKELLIEGVSGQGDSSSSSSSSQRDVKCNAVADCYGASNNDAALEKSMCSFPGRVNVGFISA